MSRGPNTWRPGIGTAERTIGSAIPPFHRHRQHLGVEETDAIIHCRSLRPKPACNHTTNRASITTSAKSVGATLMMMMNYGITGTQRRTTMSVGHAKRSVALFVSPPPDKRIVGNTLNGLMSSISTATQSSENTIATYTPTAPTANGASKTRTTSVAT